MSKRAEIDKEWNNNKKQMSYNRASSQEPTHRMFYGIKKKLWNALDVYGMCRSVSGWMLLSWILLDFRSIPARCAHHCFADDKTSKCLETSIKQKKNQNTRKKWMISKLGARCYVTRNHHAAARGTDFSQSYVDGRPDNKLGTSRI